MDDADLIEAAWAFNVKLECSGRTREDAEIALGGAILNLHDLDGILDRIEALSAQVKVAGANRFYIDCEFDGHRGPLLSIALVKHDGDSLYITTTAEARDEWVIANVLPLLDSHDCRKVVRCRVNEVGLVIRTFVTGDHPIFVADSPVDIGRVCDALSTGINGGWASAEYPCMTFEVHNIDCYPTTLEGAVQHNAWWDAMALRQALTAWKEG